MLIFSYALALYAYFGHNYKNRRNMNFSIATISLLCFRISWFNLWNFKPYTTLPLIPNVFLGLGVCVHSFVVDERFRSTTHPPSTGSTPPSWSSSSSEWRVWAGGGRDGVLPPNPVLDHRRAWLTTTRAPPHHNKKGHRRRRRRRRASLFDVNGSLLCCRLLLPIRS